jgi:uncharacterized membrane protein
MSSASEEPEARPDALAHERVAASFLVGIAVAAALVVAGEPRLAPVAGWDAAGVVFCVWMWASIWPLGAARTARRAVRDDSGRFVADTILLSASVVSLVAVGSVLAKASSEHGSAKPLLAGLGAVSVVIAWTVVHTVFTVHYARLYYTPPAGGIDFNEQAPPRYTDFAYLAFTVGMTFQVSDTDIQTKEIRVAILHHMWFAYLFGAVVIATTINLVANL